MISSSKISKHLKVVVRKRWFYSLHPLCLW